MRLLDGCGNDGGGRIVYDRIGYGSSSGGDEGSVLISVSGGDCVLLLHLARFL